MYTDNSEFKINLDVVKNLMNKTAFSKPQWKAMISEYPMTYEKCPFKNDPEIKEHAEKVMTEYFFNHPDEFVSIGGELKCPKEFVQNPKMIEAVQYGWVHKLKSNPTVETAMYFLLSTDRAMVLRDKVAENFRPLVDKAYNIFVNIHKKMGREEELNEEEMALANFIKETVGEKVLGKKRDPLEVEDEAKKEVRELPELTVDKILDMYNAGKISKEKMEQMMQTLKREAEEKTDKIYKRCGFKHEHVKYEIKK